jgi:rare lipoprotein A
MSPTRVLTRRQLVPGGLLAGLALTGSAFSFGSHDPAPSPQTVAQAVALPSPVSPALPTPVHARRASRGVARAALPVRYVSREVAVGRTFSGYASWYGGSFQGRRTANGERFDTHELTAASRTLPFGTRLRVCRRSRCVVVRVNDRGPYVGSRLLDLSKAARDRLGFSGVARVTCTRIHTRRVAVRPAVRRPAHARPVLPVRPTAVPVAPALAASTEEQRPKGADARLAAGTLLLAGTGLTWLRRRRPSAP